MKTAHNLQDKTFFHVLYSHQDEKWHVKEDSGESLAIRDCKAEAIQEAMELAEAIRGIEREVVVH